MTKKLTILAQHRLIILTALAALNGAFLFVPLANSADFGGDCCADLEDRIAELEATAARKGNRNVSLTISGLINQGVLAWDDGGEQNVSQVTNSNSADRFRFDGNSKLNADVSVGFYLEIGIRNGSSAGIDQFQDEADGDRLDVKQSLWYMRSKSYGALSLGLGAPATDDIITYNLGGTNVAGSANVPLVGGGFFARDSATGTLNSQAAGNRIAMRWRRFADQLDTPTANLVRYDSPVIMGFVASASWGEDDFWDVALRYAKKTETFSFAAGIGYHYTTDESNRTFGWPPAGDGEPNGRNTRIHELKGSASLMHRPTGLFVSGAYVHRSFDGNDLGVLNFACFTSPDAALIRAQGIACDNRPDFDYYWASAGIRQRWLKAGSTSIYGEYARAEDGITGLNVAVASATGGDVDFVTSSAMNVWGVGLVQEISAAEMDVYFSYRHFEADVTGLEAGGGIRTAPIEDIGLLTAGTRIRF